MLTICCCYFKLRTGGLILGWLGMTSIFSIISNSLVIHNNGSTFDPNAKIDPEQQRMILVLAYVGFVQGILALHVSSAMLYGIYKNKPKYLIPWMVFSVLSVCTYFVVLGIYMPVLLVVGVIAAVINGYFVYCIYSLYKEMMGAYEILA